MIYLKSDFLTNYMTALEKQDERLVMDMLTEQIARIIVNDKKDFIFGLKKSGYQMPDNMSDKKLADVIVENLGQKHMMYTLSYYIAKNNDALLGAEKDAQRQEEGKKTPNTQDAVKTIAKGIMMVEGELKSEEAAQVLVKKRIYLMIGGEKKAQGKTQKTTKTSNASGEKKGNKMVVIISVAAAAALLFFIIRYFYLKKKGGASTAPPVA